MVKYVVSLCLLLAMLTSCSKTSSPTSPGSTTFVQPKTGSVFKYDNYNTDTTTSQPVPSSRDTSVQTIAQTGMTYMGKTNVTMNIESSKNNTDTSYYSFESNNDIGLFFPDGNGSGKWINLPIASKTAVTVVISDTTIDFLGTKSHTKFSMTNTYIGEETMTYKGQSVTVIKVKRTITTETTVGGVTSTDSQEGFGYYAPSIGNLLKQEAPPVTISGSKFEGQVNLLIDYTLK